MLRACSAVYDRAALLGRVHELASGTLVNTRVLPGRGRFLIVDSLLLHDTIIKAYGEMHKPIFLAFYPDPTLHVAPVKVWSVNASMHDPSCRMQTFQEWIIKDNMASAAFVLSEPMREAVSSAIGKYAGIGIHFFAVNAFRTHANVVVAARCGPEPIATPLRATRRESSKRIHRF